MIRQGSKRLTILTAAAAVAASLAALGASAPATAATPIGYHELGLSTGGSKACPASTTTVSKGRTVHGNGSTTSVGATKRFVLRSKKDPKDKIVARTSASSVANVQLSSGDLSTAKLSISVQSSYTSTRSVKKTACQKASAGAFEIGSYDFTLSQPTVLKPKLFGNVSGSGLCTVSISPASSGDSLVMPLWSSDLVGGMFRAPAGASTFTADPGDYSLSTICIATAGPKQARRSRVNADFTLTATPVVP